MLQPLLNWHITSPFGQRFHPIENVYKFHNGVDLRASMDTAVRAPADSTVEKLYNNQLGGLQIILNHNNGYKTGYAHLNSAKVKQGDHVKKGQVFAYTGNSGTGTAPHLHFTVRFNNAFINPESITFTTKKKTFADVALLLVAAVVSLIFLKK